MRNIICLLLILQCSVLQAQEIVDNWKYTLRRPDQGLRDAKFDDASWKQGFGGFGTRDTPGSRVGTTWATNSIWLRKTFTLNEIPTNPALLIHHDETAEVYINGQQVAAVKGFTTKYILVPIPEQKRSSIKAGRNLIAVHCSQTNGGQFIDVHLIDADNIPELPTPKRSYNLYYCVADKITGPYGPRKFAGRFLGHGTPFQTKDGKWWCTAFFNANVPPESREGIETRDIGDNARTINEQGVTIVPLDVRTLDSGEVYIRAKDPAYATPGPDEAQKS